MKEESSNKNETIENKGNGTQSKIRICATVVAILIVLGLIAYVTNTMVKKANYTAENPEVTIEVENFGTIKAELYPQYAPNTVTNFIALANRGFYNGLTFHRTIPDFMIQGGDKKGDGSGSASLSDLGIEQDKSEDSTTNSLSGTSTDSNDYNIKGEFILNGFNQNTLKHKKGVLSMARSDYSSQGSTTIAKKGYDSASSQFFIMNSDNASLDGAYAAFGMVTDGLDVVEKIANVEVETREEATEEEGQDTTKTKDRPVEPPVIKSITVDTKGVDYGMPETLEPFDYYSYLMQQYYGGSNSSGLTSATSSN